MATRPILIAATVLLVLPVLATSVQASDQAAPSPADDPRVIELEMVGVGRFLLDGEVVRALRIVPGEVVVFRVDNTSGQELGFEVGNYDRICDPSRTPRWSIPAWTEGIRELTWEVPTGARNRRWGHRGRYCQLGEFSVGSESAEIRTPPAPTVTGPLSVHLEHSEQWISFDADFDGTTSAVAWQTFGNPWRTLYLSRSDDVAFGDFATMPIANDVDDHAVAICAGDVVVSYLQRAPDDDRRLWLVRLPRDGGPAESVEIRAPFGPRGSIDVACTEDRAYVAWAESVDDEWHAFARAVSLPDLRLSTVYDAGPARRHRVAVAATDTHGLLAWQEGKRIRLARLGTSAVEAAEAVEAAGAVDEQRLAALSTKTVVRRGSTPMLDADGTNVVLGYDRWNVVFIRSSRDGGTTFDRRRGFGREALGGIPREVDSLAVEGPDIVATAVVFYGPRGEQVWDRQRFRSDDFGRTWTTSRIGDPAFAIARDGFLVTADGVKVAEAYTDGEYADDWDLRVRRERERARRARR